MKTILTIVALLIFTNLIGQDMNEHKWKHRVLIVQSSQELSDKYQKQLKEFDGWENDLKERKLVLYVVVADKYSIINYAKGITHKSWKPNNSSLVRLLNNADTFKVLLIGLDGGIKLERETVLGRQELFDIIDSMPMRISELKNLEKDN